MKLHLEKVKHIFIAADMKLNTDKRDFYKSWMFK